MSCSGHTTDTSLDQGCAATWTLQNHYRQVPDHTAARLDTVSSTPAWSPAELALLGFSLLSLATCCVVISAKKYFWIDELFSWTLVTDQSLSHMLCALWHGADGAPPLYYLITRGWTSLFGTSELAFRSFSCAGFMVALVVTWITLRRAFGRWPAAVAALFVFGLSPLIAYQVGEARFYGLLTALVAIAVYLYARAVAAPSISRALALAIWVTHLALVYCHVYGLFYSGGILLAWIMSDRLSGRRWHSGYLAVLLAWIMFLPWLPAVRAVSETGQPHSWMPVPTGRDLITSFGFSLQGAAVVLAAIVLLGALTPSHLFKRPSLGSSQSQNDVRWRIQRIGAAVLIVLLGLAGLRHSTIGAWSLTAVAHALLLQEHEGILLLLLVTFAVLRAVSEFRRREGEPGTRPLAVSPSIALLIVGLGLLGIPIVSFVASQVGPSIFTPRYFIPASLGLAPCVAYFVEWSSQTSLGISEDEATARSHDMLITAAWTVLVTVLAALPALHSLHAPTRHSLGMEIEAVAPANAFIVVENELDLLPLLHYQQRQDLTYVYPMDWAAAKSATELDATVGYKQMAIWERVGYANSTMLSGSEVPCTKPEFLVLNSRRNAWFDDRILSDSALAVKQIGSSRPPLHPFVIYFVHRRGTSVPVACRTTSISVP